MAAWARVSDVLGKSAVAAPPPIPAAHPAPSLGPKPPSLHWAIVLGLTIVTWGLFGLIWVFVHAVWIKRIDPRSKALYALSGGLAGLLTLAFLSGMSGGSDGLELLAQLVWVAAVLVAYFDMRAAIEARYNIELSGIMTFFFNVIYLQYHLRLIAKGQHTPNSARMLT
jgi:hypothetical protein